MHFRLALRQLLKNKTFSILNILGLTLGLTTFLLIVLYVADELSYDRYNINADRIARIHTDITLNGAMTPFADAAPPVAQTLARDYPQVAAAVRVLPEEDHLFHKGDQVIQEPRLAFVDPGFFQVFTFPAIQGDPESALKDPHSAIITASTAKRYFQTTNAIGRTLASAEGSSIYTIRAVIADMPSQSHFHYDILLSMVGNGLGKNNSFYAMYRMSTEVLLKPGASRPAFHKKLAEFMRTYAPEYAAMEADNNGSYKDILSEMPLTDIHLHSDRTDELETNSNIEYIYIFSAIAVFVLLIAGVNFMNLSTARSANRAREIGVRKVLGSPRSLLIAQFLAESFLLTIAAALLALLLSALSLPWFNRLTGKELTLNTAWLLPALAAIVLFLGLFSGAWPAFFLSSFRPVQVLKGKLALGGRGSGFRNTLVVLQFTVSVLLIVGTLVVYSQLSYIRNKDMGFDRSQVLVVKGLDQIAGAPGAPLVPTLAYLQQDVRSWPGVTDATLTSFLPTGKRRWHNWGVVKGLPNSLQTELWEVDDRYIPTMEINVTQGRNFSAQFGTDSTAIIINQTAAQRFGIADDPLGKTISYQGYWHPTAFHVIGVIKDFNFNSIRSSVTPLVLIDRADYAPYLAIRIQPGNVPAIMDRMKAKWTSLGTHRPFDYSFMDADFDALYRAEQRMGGVVIVLTALAIAIACLGLFGLAAYAAEQRTREIGIRKVLGAGSGNIIALLSKDFARLVVMAILIASPLAWLMLQRWLENFAYRTTITVWPFSIAAGIILLAAIATTLFQSIRAAVVNPAETLRQSGE